MAWIELHQSLPGHRKTRCAARALNITKAQFIGHIIQFWLWALDNAPDGCLAGIDAETIAEVTDWEGDPDLFLTVLVASGFIDESDEGSPVIHDWHDYAGKLIYSRRKDRERKRKMKDSSGTAVEFQRNDNNSSGNTPIPSAPYPTLPYPTLPYPTNIPIPNTVSGRVPPTPTSTALQGEGNENSFQGGGKDKDKVKRGRIPKGHVIFNEEPTPIEYVPDEYIEYLVTHAENQSLARMARAEKHRRELDGKPQSLPSPPGSAQSIDECIARVSALIPGHNLTPHTIRAEVQRLACVKTISEIPMDGKLQALIMQAINGMQKG